MNARVRNVHFDLTGVPRYWHGGRKSLTTFLDALSIIFPPGERFMIEAVRAQQHNMRGPTQVQQVRLFCGQEAMHEREHAQYNAMLTRQGYPAAELESDMASTLNWLKRHLSPLSLVGVSAGIEHNTTIMGEWLVSRPLLLSGADPRMAELWWWHTAEEIEHKEVAFNVYLASGGGYLRRVLTMVLATSVLWSKLLQYHVRLLAADGAHSWAEWRRLLHFLFIDPGGMGGLALVYLQYFLPGFRPITQHRERVLADLRRAATTQNSARALGIV